MQTRRRDGIDFSDISINFNKGAAGSYSGPILWNGAQPTDLYYSSRWQVLEEDVTPVGLPGYVSNQYVWGLAYIDEMVLRDSLYNGGGSLGASGSGLDQRIYPVVDANWNTTAVLAPAKKFQNHFFCSTLLNQYVAKKAADFSGL